ncbi:hypothetical protein BDV96DRAFT_659231 [Lophiotrema nucula]|uniref:F-box domain-containing protein n=1 Tax=Lophiotrema nucula TaxID=690887 RepID=A0A6A5Z906_9PLEO|nr:hypothetical protein BDV96DRAFT_659231 [Lophiotrema nucula]
MLPPSPPPTPPPMPTQAVSQTANTSGTPPTAMLRVFSINELATPIFSQISFKDLFRYRRVSKAWNNLLTHGDPFAGFAYVKPKDEALWHHLAKVNHNPIQIRNEKGCFMATVGANSCVRPFCLDYWPHNVPKTDAINPLFVERAMQSRRSHGTCFTIRGRSAIFLSFNRADIEPLLLLLTTTPWEASWRKTLLTNPPVYRFFAFSPSPRDRVERDTGVTMEDAAVFLKEVYDSEARELIPDISEHMRTAAREKRIKEESIKMRENSLEDFAE